MTAFWTLLTCRLILKLQVNVFSIQWTNEAFGPKCNKHPNNFQQCFFDATKAMVTWELEAVFDEHRIQIHLSFLNQTKQYLKKSYHISLQALQILQARTSRKNDRCAQFFFSKRNKFQMNWKEIVWFSISLKYYCDEEAESQPWKFLPLLGSNFFFIFFLRYKYQFSNQRVSRGCTGKTGDDHEVTK